MSSIVTFDPDLRRLERHMNRMFDDFFGDIGRRTAADAAGSGNSQTSLSNWTPRIEAYETEKEFIVNAELPGIPKDKVNLDVRDNNLIISGENAQSEEFTQGSRHYTERRYGSFSRTIPLPANLKHDETKAKYDHGVLNVSFPKAAVVQSKKITIS